MADILKDGELKKEVVTYLQTELLDVIGGSERAGMEANWDRWRRQREAKPESAEKSYPWAGACFHKDVKILTLTGWKLVKDAKVGEKVLTREPLTGKGQYKEVTEVFEYEAPKEGLVHLKNNYFDIQVTGNHRFSLESRNNRTPKIVTAKEVMNGFVGEGNNLLPLTCDINTEPALSFFGYNPEDFLELVGWYISEGWSYKHRCIGIGQSLKSNPKNVLEIKELLKRLGLSYSYNGVSFLVNVTSTIVDNFRLLGRSWEKYIPRMFLDVSKDQLGHLFKTLIKGDGCEYWPTDKHRNYPSTTYYTVSYRLAEDIQELATRLGFSAAIHKRFPREGGKLRGRIIMSAHIAYDISIRYIKKSRFRHDRCKIEYVPYSEKVYSLNVPSWHTIYVKQNGLPLWTMNSNVVPPLSLINTNGAFAFVNASLGRRKPFWEVNTQVDGLEKEAAGLAHLLSVLAESKYHLNLRGVNKTVLYDLVSLGTQFVKIPWLVDQQMFKRYDDAGNLTQVTRIRHNSPAAIPIRIEDFFTRPYWYDIQRAPWIASRTWLMKHELLQREALGIYENVDEVIKLAHEDFDDNMQAELSRRGIEISGYPKDMYPIYQVNLFWDVDGDGIPEDIVLWFEPLTGTILRQEYNDLGIRDTVRIPYLDMPYQLYGLGIGALTDGMQEEATSLHNMRIDGTHISLLQMWATRKGSGLGPKEELRPLKLFELDDVDDLKAFKFPEIGPSTLSSELVAKEYAGRATGMSDYMMGFESQSIRSRNTLGGTMFLANQGNKVQASILGSIENGYSTIGQIVVFQLVKNKDKVKELLYSLISEDDRNALDNVLDMNVEDIPVKFDFKIRTMETEKSEEAQRQGILTLTQLYTMYGKQIFQLLPTIYNPQVPPQIKEVAGKFFLGATKLMDKVLKFFGEENTKSLLPYIKDIQMMVEAIDNLREQNLGGSNVRGNEQEVRGIGGPSSGAPTVAGGNHKPKKYPEYADLSG